MDGEGKPPYKADVLVQGRAISAIGDLKNKRARKTIDGLGNYLTPGFIDIDTDSDHYLSLFTNPSQSDFTGQGVTTTIGGHCGASLAPLLYGTLESIRKWADPEEINVNWHTVAEFLATLEKLQLGVNFGTLIGHSTVRRSLIGEANRRLSQKELNVFKQILTQALNEGAFGLSTGLGYLHGRQASPAEIKTLVEIVARYDGVYTTHLRNETSELLSSVQEIIKIAKATKARTIISHLRPIKKFEKQYQEALEEIDKSAARASIYFNIYPYDTSLKTVYTLLPLWIQESNLETMTKNLQDKKTADRVLKELKKINPNTIKIAGAPKHHYLIGKTLRELADNLNISPAEALLRLMRITDLRATVFHENINSEIMTQALASNRSFIASHGNGLLPGESLVHERAVNTFPKYLEIAVKSSGVPIETAIKKITADPARYFGLKHRGVVKERNIADLVILGKNDYQVKQVILGGKIVGEETTRGEILRHPIK